jgi:hypothetical protein
MWELFGDEMTRLPTMLFKVLMEIVVGVDICRCVRDQVGLGRRCGAFI